MSTWQPIDTAPKGGDAILASTVTGNMAVIYWRKGEGWELLYTGSYAEDGEWCERPSHWMPLPLSPTKSKPPGPDNQTVGVI